MFEVSKYKNSNVKLSIRLPEKMNETLRKIAKKEEMSFNNVIVSCIQNSLDQIDMDLYKDVDIYNDDEITVWTLRLAPKVLLILFNNSLN